jgi:hypothetical protein
MNTLRSVSIRSGLEHSLLTENGDTFPSISRDFQLGLHLDPINSATCLIAARMLSLLCSIPRLFAQVSVRTQHHDDRRTGLDLNETALKISNVSVNHFGKLFSVAVAVYGPDLCPGVVRSPTRDFEQDTQRYLPHLRVTLVQVRYSMSCQHKLLPTF